MPRRIFVDTEWTAPPWSDHCALMWIGLADEAGGVWWGVSDAVPIDPPADAPLAGASRLIEPGVPRLSAAQLADGVRGFCGQVDEFWAWIPPLDRFAAWFRLGDDAAPALYARHRDVDLHMLQALVNPWPAGWPRQVHDLQAAATAAGVEPPPRAADHLHPRVHATWNRTLFQRIQAAGGA